MCPLCEKGSSSPAGRSSNVVSGFAGCVPESLRAFAYGLLAASLGRALFGETAGLASAVAVGMAAQAGAGASTESPWGMLASEVRPSNRF